MLLTFLLQAGAGGDTAVHFTLGGGFTALVAHTIWREIRDRRSNGNGKTKCHAEEIEYWDRAEDKITKPIVDAVNGLRDELRRRR